MANIAFKMNYCDGGITNQSVGFNGICSDEMIEYNIELQKNAWCSNEICLCKQYWDFEITRTELEDNWQPEYNGPFVCYESCALRDWIASAGINSIGRIRHFNFAEELPNHLCVLTTVNPEDKRGNRVIFAMFLIDKVVINKYDYSHCVTADKKYRLQFYPKEMKKAKFWSVYRNAVRPSKKRWVSGLYRYFDDEDAVQFLKMAVEIKRGTSEESLAIEFLNHYCKIHNI